MLATIWKTHGFWQLDGWLFNQSTIYALLGSYVNCSLIRKINALLARSLTRTCGSNLNGLARSTSTSEQIVYMIHTRAPGSSGQKWLSISRVESNRCHTRVFCKPVACARDSFVFLPALTSPLGALSCLQLDCGTMSCLRYHFWSFPIFKINRFQIWFVKSRRRSGYT